MPRQPFEITLRLVLVRLVFYAALVLSMLVVLQRKYFLLICTVFIVIHHAYMSIVPRSFNLPRVADLVLTIFEAIALVLPYLKVFNKWMSPIINKWMPRTAFFFNFMQWALILFLVASAASKILDIRKYGLADRCDIRRTGPIWHARNPRTLYLVRDIFFGSAPWEAQFTGEPKWIIYSRGVLATGIIIIVIIFACYNMVLETLNQVALTPVNDLRGYYTPSDFTITQTPVWNVILTRLTNGSDNVNFTSAIKVTPLRTLEDDPCHPAPELVSLDIARELRTVEHVAFHCPSSTQIRTGQLLNSPVVSQDIMPDLLITVNFTALNISSTTIVNAPTNSVQLMIGVTNDTTKVFMTTMPTTLIPGVNLFGLVRLHIRQTMSSSVLAVIGLFDLHNTFLVSDIDTVWPDPRASASDSSRIPKDPNIATIRLTRQIDDSEWHIIQDHLDKSIIRGLSSSGGLWTALGGILSLFFGSSIMHIMFDSRLFSMFGLAHNVKSTEVRASCIGAEAYPRLISDIQEDEKGLNSLICDQVVDVGLLIEHVVDDQSEIQLLPRTG